MLASSDGFRSIERRGPDRSLVTEQTLKTGRPIVPFSEAGARALGGGYWVEVTRATRRLLRYHESGEGLELRILGVGPALLRFGGVEVAVGTELISCTYRIRGGLLALGEGGTISVSQVGGSPTELRVAVDGFLARGGLVYALQRRLHVAISRRFFRRLISEEAR
jgi:hypothetical protein